MNDDENPPPRRTCSLPHCDEPADRGCCTGTTPHYLCDVCFCGYASSQFTAMGAFEHERTSADGIISAPGELPCYLFLTNQCDCARIPNTTLARVLSTDPIAFEAYEAAMRRSIQSRQNEEEAAAEAALEQREQESTPLEILHQVVVEVLSRGGYVACPTCHQHGQKNDACMHMVCPCGTRFCYCCGRQRGDGPRNCRSGRGNGCDSPSPYLENHPGWRNFSLNEEESMGFGALYEFHRRRMAYFLRQVKEHYPAELWDEFRQAHPGILQDTPTKGRQIEWDEIDTAEPPLFGCTTVNELEWKNDGTLACIELVQEQVRREPRFPPKMPVSCHDHKGFVIVWMIGFILTIIPLSFGAAFDSPALRRAGNILIALLAGTGLPVVAMCTVDHFAANPQYGCICEVQCLRGRNNESPYLATDGRWSNHRKLYWYSFFCGIALASVCLNSQNVPFLRALGVFLLTLILVSYSGITLLVNAAEPPNGLDFRHFLARVFLLTVMLSIGVGILAVYNDSYIGNVAGKVFFALGFAGMFAEILPRLQQDQLFTRTPNNRRLVLSYMFCIALAVGSLMVGIGGSSHVYIVGIVLLVTAFAITLPLYLNEPAQY